MATQTVTLSTTGSGNWTVPAGVTSITYKVWGAGAYGYLGAGGGGASVTGTRSVTPGASIPYKVGASLDPNVVGSLVDGEDSWLVSSTTIKAVGGKMTIDGVTGGLGGTAAASIGTTKFSGGRGGSAFDGAPAYCGGGGSSPTTAANGNNAANATSTASTAGANSPSGAAGGARIILSPPSTPTAGVSNVNGGGGGGGGIMAADFSSGVAGGAGGAPAAGGGGGVDPATSTIAPGGRGQIIIEYEDGVGSGVTGTLSVTDGADTLAASGKVYVSGSLARTDGADTLAASGAVLVTGSLARTDPADTLTAIGRVLVTGSLNVTDADDTLAASGTVSYPPITGSLAVTDDPDTLAATGSVLVLGSLAANDADDTLSAAGVVLVAGSLSVTDDLDTLVASGSAPATGSFAVTDAADTLVASGAVLVRGSLAVTDGADTLVANGNVTIPDPITFVGVTTNAGGAGTTINKPSGVQADDYMFVFVPHGSGSISGGDGNWLKRDVAWTGGLGYTTSILFKKLSATDVSASLSVNGLSTNGFMTAAYRGPANAVVMASNGAGTGTTLSLTRNDKNAFSLGQVSFTSDRDETGTANAPTGWTKRQNFLAQHFSTALGDRIDGTQLANSGADTWTNFSTSYDQVGFNIEVLADIPTELPAMSSNNLGGAYIISASNSTYGAAWQAFDQNNSTFWGSNPAESWLKIQFPGQRKISRYYVRNRTGFTNQTPTAFTFEGSNDNSNWTVLDTRSSVTFTDGGENTYSISSPGNYRYYRLNISANSNNSTIAVVAGLRFDFAYGVEGSLAVTDQPDTLVATGSVLVTGALAANDDDDTLTATGSVAVTGSLNVTDEPDALAASGSVAITGYLAVTDEPDTLVATGSSPLVNYLRVTDDPDTLVAYGSVLVTGTLATTDPDDTLEASGQVTETTRYGTLEVTDEPDTLVAFGSVSVSGSLVVIDGPDILSAVGIVRGFRPSPTSNENWNPQIPATEAWNPQTPANEAWSPQNPAEEEWHPQTATSKDWRR